MEVVAFQVLKASGLWGWVEMSYALHCVSVTPAIMVQQSKCTQWLKVLLELDGVTSGNSVRCSDFRLRKAERLGRCFAALICYAFSNSAIRVLSHDIA